MARRGLKFLNSLKKSSLVLLFSSFIMSCATTAHVHSRYLALGNLAAKEGKFLDAATQFEKALVELPDSLPAKRNLGLVKVKLGDYENAVRLLKEVYSSYRDDIEVQYFLGEGYRGLRNYQLAADHYQKGLRLDPADLRLVKALAWSWLKIGKTEWSINLVEPFLSTNPTDHQIRLILANAYNQVGKGKNAIALLKFLEDEKFRIQSKDRTTAIAEHMLLLSALADAYQETDNCRSALKHYFHVLKFRPFFDGALTGAANCLFKSGNDERAIGFLERAVRANPQSTQANFMLARALEKRSKDRSIVYFNRFLKLTENSPDAFSGEREVAKRVLAESTLRR